MFGDHCHSALLTADGEPRRRRMPEPARRAPAGPSQQVALEVQRMWVLAAVAKIAHESGIEHVSLDRVAARAGIARSALDGMFEDRGECIAATFRVACALAAERAIPWFASEVGAVERIRVAVSQLLCFCRDEPELASVALSEAGELARQRARMIRTLARIAADELDVCCPDYAAGEALEAAVAQALELVGLSLAGPRGAEPESLLEPVLVALLTPHLGAAAARIEASLPTRVEAAEPARVFPDRRAGLDVRLTAHVLSGQPEPERPRPSAEGRPPAPSQEPPRRSRG